MKKSPNMSVFCTGEFTPFTLIGIIMHKVNICLMNCSLKRLGLPICHRIYLLGIPEQDSNTEVVMLMLLILQFCNILNHTRCENGRFFPIRFVITYTIAQK